MLALLLSNIDSKEEKSKFEKMYHKYINLFMYLAIQKLSNQEDAEDAVQEALLYIANNFSKISAMDEKAQKSYLITIVNGFSIDAYRKRTSQNNHIDHLASVEISGEDIEDYSIIEISDAIDKLDDEERNYIYLTYIYGYKSNEIAKMYNVKDTYVRKKLQFARRDLRNILNGGENDE